MLDDTHFFTVTDLKQYSYCARVLFYERCLPHIRPRTYKMDAGRDEHEDEQRRAARRTLGRYAVGEGTRRFDLALRSSTLHLSGVVDEVVTTASGEIFAVDYKLAEKVGHNHKLQLTAYTLLLEEQSGQPVRRGFVVLIPLRRTVEVAITPALRSEVRTLLTALTKMVEYEQMPAPTTVAARCVSCEFRRFCNDV